MTEGGILYPVSIDGFEGPLDVLLRLVLRRLGAAPHCVLDRTVEVGDLDVEVQHHLLLAGDVRPHRSDVVG